MSLASTSAGATVVNFTYTGAAQAFVVPNLVNSIFVETWGAQGWSGANSGGLGGYTSGDLSVATGETLWVYVGGQGTGAIGFKIPMGGGFNGGGDGQSNSTSALFVGGGGGASDVRQGIDNLLNRMIVAGGGGGSTNNFGAFGGAGGGLVGGNGGSAGGGLFPGGTGGTQAAGGSSNGAFGLGGDALTTMIPWNGGGGGGWYGGGVSPAHAGGGGGSSYIGGVSNGTMLQGVRSGDGLVRLTFQASSAAPIPEPATFAILGLGLAGLGFMRRRRFNA